MPIDVRAIQSSDSTEIYITATPEIGASVQDQAARTFGDIRDALRRMDARLLHERVFATDNALEIIRPIRIEAYGDLDDGVPPTRLAVPAGESGDFSGVQVHAVSDRREPAPLRLGEMVCGRTLTRKGYKYITVSGLSAPDAGDASAQARSTFEKAEFALERAGANMLSVARTWVWLGDILAWYGDFNRVRTRFFTERGLLDGRPESARPPASTGIGVSLAGRPHCGLDLIAILGGRDLMRHYNASGNQRSPYEYGSAFSRATRAITPAGQTVYVSGTASIDASGKTQHIGNAAAQIKQTIANVCAVFRCMDCTDADVVQAIAYSKTRPIESLFLARSGTLAWPCVSVIADICREELLFEIEVTACPGARKV